jgi:hypothetical protein
VNIFFLIEKKNSFDAAQKILGTKLKSNGLVLVLKIGLLILKVQWLKLRFV